MHPLLRAYVKSHLIEHPAATMPLALLVTMFHDTLSKSDLSAWSRSRIIGELATAGFALGTVAKVLHVAGLAPRGAWVESNGKLEHVCSSK